MCLVILITYVLVRMQHATLYTYTQHTYIHIHTYNNFASTHSIRGSSLLSSPMAPMNGCQKSSTHRLHHSSSKSTRHSHTSTAYSPYHCPLLQPMPKQEHEFSLHVNNFDQEEHKGVKWYGKRSLSGSVPEYVLATSTTHHGPPIISSRNHRSIRSDLPPSHRPFSSAAEIQYFASLPRIQQDVIRPSHTGIQNQQCSLCVVTSNHPTKASMQNDETPPRRKCTARSTQ
ncbi:hypothetical protein V8C44DRAFT_219333 [Trichoderma aethiopicum]